MAYGNYGNGNYNNGGNYQRGNGGYNRGGYQQQQQQQTPPPAPVVPQEFIEERIAIYDLFVQAIKDSGHDPADFAFALGGWITSFCLEAKRNK